MDTNVMRLLLRRRGFADDPVGDAPQVGTELPELDLTPEANSVAKLRDDSPEPETSPDSDPKDWSEPGQPPAPPLVQGDDEQRRQVWEYLRAKMAREMDPEGRERRRTANALLVAAGREPSFEVDAKHSVAPELLQYLGSRNRDDSSERAAGQRAADAEARAKMAEQRFGLDSSTRQAELTLKQLEAERKRRADEAEQPLRDARVRESEARARGVAARSKAMADKADNTEGGTTDIVFDGEMLKQVRASPNRIVNATQQRQVADRAAEWGQMVRLSDSLAASLDEWARTPGQSARNQVLLKVTMAAQSLTRALGGGAMAEHEKGLAFNALGGQLTDPLQLSNLLQSMAGNDEAAARAAASMSERARAIRPLAHEMVKGFAQGYGYEAQTSPSPAPQAVPSPAPAAPPTPQAEPQPAAPQAGADKIPMISLASGKTVMLSPAAAAELEKAGKVRKP